MNYQWHCSYRLPDGKAICGKEARWLAWYRSTGGLYNYLCDQHAKEMIEDISYEMVCLRAITDAIPSERIESQV